MPEVPSAPSTLDGSAAVASPDVPTSAPLSSGSPSQSTSSAIDVAPAAEPAPSSAEPQTVPDPPLGSAEPIPASATEYTRYVNGRFRYAVDVPDFLIGQGEADNGDGQRFVSPDGLATLTVFGSNLPTADTATGAHAQALADAADNGRSVTYEVAGEDAFTVSGYEPNGDIFFTRSWIRGGRQVTMDWEYPAEMQPLVGAAIEQAEDTFNVN